MLECVSGDVTAQVALQPALKFNGGGHINHTIFWTNLSPNGGGEPQGEPRGPWKEFKHFFVWLTSTELSSIGGKNIFGRVMKMLS